MKRLCKIEGCAEGCFGHGYCQLHYNRWRRTGDPLMVRPRRRRYETAESRIARQTQPEGDCIVFTGGQQRRSGHRTISFENHLRGVHRVAWVLANGPVPEGQVVMHRCDNPPCVKLEHLVLGTVADNNLDRDQKGRHRPLPGSKNGNARLTEWQVAEIRVHLTRSISQAAIGARYGVSQSLVWLIKAGRAWTHVEPASWSVPEIPKLAEDGAR